jgi:hypothetical protein
LQQQLYTHTAVGAEIVVICAGKEGCQQSNIALVPNTLLMDGTFGRHGRDEKFICNFG